jgi:hypothetical protein
MSVSCECSVLSGRGPCVGLITRPQQFAECGVSDCDRKASRISTPWSTRGCCAMEKKFRDACWGSLISTVTHKAEAKHRALQCTTYRMSHISHFETNSQQNGSCLSFAHLCRKNDTLHLLHSHVSFNNFELALNASARGDRQTHTNRKPRKVGPRRREP